MRFTSMNTYEDMPWAPGNLVTPSVASGCLIKVLHFEPLTEALSFLYCMTPRFCPGQHLLPRQRRGELSHLGHVLDDAVR